MEHSQEQVTSPPGEEGPTEGVHALQITSPEPPQPCHESPYPSLHELNKRHLYPKPPSGREDDGETQDKTCQSQVSESALFESELDCASDSGSNKASAPLGHLEGERSRIVSHPSVLDCQEDRENLTSL